MLIGLRLYIIKCQYEITNLNSFDKSQIKDDYKKSQFTITITMKIMVFNSNLNQQNFAL